MIQFLFTKTPLVFLVQNFWRDEAFSYFMAKKNLWDIMVYSARDFSPPLYHLVLHFWIKAFGSSEIAVRSLSFFFYWATVYAVSHYLNDIFKMKLKKALLYTLLVAANPLLIYYAFEARMYTMLAFFSVLSFYFLYRKNSKLYLLTAILGLYTHYFMVLVIAGQYLLIKFRQKTALLTFLPWLFFVAVNKGFSVGSFWIQNFPLGNLFNFIGLLYSGYEIEFNFYGKEVVFLSLILWLLVGFGYFYWRKKFSDQKKLFVHLLTWAILMPLFVVLVSFIKPVFLPRYLIFSTVGLVLLLIFFIDRLPLLVKITAIGFIFALTVNYNQLQIRDRRKVDIKTTINEIKFLAKPDDVLYVTSELDFFTAEYYFGENKVYIWGKSYSDIPSYVGKALIPKDKVVSLLPFYPKKAFVLTPDGSYTVKALY